MWVSRYAPDAAEPLAAAQLRTATVVDPAIVELTRLRIAMLLSNRGALRRDRNPAAVAAGLTEDKVGALAAWPSSPLFSETDRACLGLAEQFVIDVSSVSDSLVAHVLEALGPAGLYGYVQALWVLDMTQRLELSMNAAAAAASTEETP